jgi:hypothetical protein
MLESVGREGLSALGDRREATIDVEIDAGDISSERARKESNGIREFVQLSNPTKRNVGEQRQDVTLDILPRCIFRRNIACCCYGTKAAFKLGTFNRSRRDGVDRDPFGGHCFRH